MRDCFPPALNRVVSSSRRAFSQGFFCAMWVVWGKDKVFVILNAVRQLCFMPTRQSGPFSIHLAALGTRTDRRLSLRACPGIHSGCPIGWGITNNVPKGTVLFCIAKKSTKKRLCCARWVPPQPPEGAGSLAGISLPFRGRGTISARISGVTRINNSHNNK